MHHPIEVICAIRETQYLTDKTFGHNLWPVKLNIAKKWLSTECGISFDSSDHGTSVQLRQLKDNLCDDSQTCLASETNLTLTAGRLGENIYTCRIFVRQVTVKIRIWRSHSKPSWDFICIFDNYLGCGDKLNWCSTAPWNPPGKREFVTCIRHIDFVIVHVICYACWTVAHAGLSGSFYFMSVTQVLRWQLFSCFLQMKSDNLTRRTVNWILSLMASCVDQQTITVSRWSSGNCSSPGLSICQKASGKQYRWYQLKKAQFRLVS